MNSTIRWWLALGGIRWWLALWSAVLGFHLSQVATSYGADFQPKLTAPQLFPEKTLAYLRIDDVRQLRSDFERSSLGRISNDAQMKPIAEEFYGSLVRITEEAFGQFGLNLDEFLSIPSGELAIALLAAPKGNRQPARTDADQESEDQDQLRITPPIFVIMLDAGQDISGIQVMLQRLGRSMASESEHLQKSADRLTLHSYQNREDSQQQFAYFIDQGVFVAATSSKAIEDLALVWLGQAGNRKTLAENSRFLSMMKRCVGTEGERPQISFYMDPMAMLRGLSPGDPASMMMLAMLSPMGLDGLEAVGGSWIVAPTEFDSIGHLHVLISSPRQGILNLLRPKSGAIKPENWVPENLAVYASVNWDVQSALLAVEQLYNQFRGADALNRDIFQPATDRTGVDFRKDLIDSMQGRITFLQGYVRPITADSQSNVIAVRINDIRRFQRDVFPKLIDWMGTEGSGETAQMGSILVHTFRSDRPRPTSGQSRQARPQESCLAVVDDYLVFSDSSYMLRQIADAQDDPTRRLGESLEFQLIDDRIQAHLQGKQASAMVYARPEEQLRTFFELVSDPEQRQGLQQLDFSSLSRFRPRFFAGQGRGLPEEIQERTPRSNPIFQALNEALQKHELPPFSEISKYLAPSGGYLVEEDTGMHFTVFTLRRE
jgi:hypothetical protein